MKSNYSYRETILFCSITWVVGTFFTNLTDYLFGLSHFATFCLVSVCGVCVFAYVRNFFTPVAKIGEEDMYVDHISPSDSVRSSNVQNDVENQTEANSRTSRIYIPPPLNIFDSHNSNLHPKEKELYYSVPDYSNIDQLSNTLP